MEKEDILEIWKVYDKKLEKNLLINLRNAEELTRIKIKSSLSSMTPVKFFTVMVGIAWVIGVDTLLLNWFSVASPFFLISLGIQVVLTKMAIGVYLYQMILIQQVNIDEPVFRTQRKIALLTSSTIWITRLLFLQLPLWTTFYWNKSMLENGNLFLWILQIFITLLFTISAIWLFLNIKYENKDKRWFRIIFSGPEWKPLMKSFELLKELKEH